MFRRRRPSCILNKPIFLYFVVSCTVFWKNPHLYFGIPANLSKPIFMYFRVLKYTNIDTRSTKHKDFVSKALLVNSNPLKLIQILVNKHFACTVDVFHNCHWAMALLLKLFLIIFKLLIRMSISISGSAIYRYLKGRRFAHINDANNCWTKIVFIIYNLLAY